MPLLVQPDKLSYNYSTTELPIQHVGIKSLLQSSQGENILAHKVANACSKSKASFFFCNSCTDPANNIGPSSVAFLSSSVAFFSSFPRYGTIILNASFPEAKFKLYKSFQFVHQHRLVLQHRYSGIYFLLKVFKVDLCFLSSSFNESFAVLSKSLRTAMAEIPIRIYQLNHTKGTNFGNQILYLLFSWWRQHNFVQCLQNCV